MMYGLKEVLVYNLFCIQVKAQSYGMGRSLNNLPCFVLLSTLKASILYLHKLQLFLVVVQAENLLSCTYGSKSQ